MIRAFILAGTLASSAGLAACEKAGEDIDSAIENVTTGEEKPGDGAFEQTGEAIDNTLGIERKDDADSIADAVDGDPDTKPD